MTDLHSPVDVVAVLEDAADAVCVSKLDRTLVWCNRSFEAVVGRSREELIGTSLSHLVHPADRERRDADLAAVRPGGEITGSRVRYRSASGEWRWMEWTIRVVPEADRIYSAGRDVTERVEAERALAEQMALMQAIVDHSPAVVVVKDMAGRYLLVNNEWCRCFAVSPEQVLGRTPAEIRSEVPGFAAGIPVPDLVDLPSMSDFEIETVDGLRTFMVVEFSVTQEGIDGEPVTVIGGIATDITDRTRDERALADREQQLAAILAASPDIISIIDEHGATRTVNDAPWRLLGYDTSHMSEEELFALVHPDDFREVNRRFTAMLRGGDPLVEVRFRLRRSDGRYVTVDTRAGAVRDSAGRVHGAVVITRDVTAQLQAEARLRAAMHRAEQGLRTKSDFLSRMSHELRTPLNAVLGFAQLLAMDDLADSQQDQVEHILRAGRTLLELIDEVLDIARLEGGHVEFTLEPVPMSAVVGEAFASAALSARRAQVQLVSNVLPSLVVRADRHRLVQVVSALVRKAVRFNTGGGMVEISAAKGPAGWVRVSITDTGPGMGPGDLDKIFEPFERPSTLPGSGESWGVGLGLTRHLVEGMGGRLRVESEIGRGSTFSIDLPLAAPAGTPRSPSGAPPSPAGSLTAPTEAPARDATATGSPEPDAESSSLDAAVFAGLHVAGDDRKGTGAGPAMAPGRRQTTFRVLLVEDGLDDLELLERALARRPGVEVLGAMQGGLALELAREHPCGLVLVDVRLPDMTVEELLGRLRAEPGTAGADLAVVSAELNAAQLRRAHGGDLAGYLTKPLDVRALLALVDEARRRAASW